MYIAKIQNAAGSILNLTGQESKWTIASITGLNPAPATINTTNIALIPGARLNSAKINTRNIVILLYLNGSVEANRQKLYEYFINGESCTFYFQNDARNVKIEGIVELTDVDLFSEQEAVQISILCMNPYFQQYFTTPPAVTIPAAKTASDPATVQYVGDVVSGFVITITVSSGTSFSRIAIYNTVTGESLGLNATNGRISGDAFTAGDVITINTISGEKSVTLTRGGVTSSAFAAFDIDNDFLALKPGNNYFYYEVASDASQNTKATVKFYPTPFYRGV